MGICNMYIDRNKILKDQTKEFIKGTIKEYKEV